MNTFKLVITYINGNTDTAYCRTMAIAIASFNSIRTVVGDDDIAGMEIKQTNPPFESTPPHSWKR